MRVRTAIKYPATAQAPPEYVQFTQERALYESLGWTDGKSIGEHPRRQVRDYLLFLQLEAHELKSEQERLRRNMPSS